MRRGSLLPSAPGGGGAAHLHVVVIDKMKFGAVPRGLHAGDTIIWVNRDIFRHTATAADRSFDVDLAAGKQGQDRAQASRARSPSSANIIPACAAC